MNDPSGDEWTLPWVNACDLKLISVRLFRLRVLGTVFPVVVCSWIDSLIRNLQPNS